MNRRDPSSADNPWEDNTLGPGHDDPWLDGSYRQSERFSTPGLSPSSHERRQFSLRTKLVALMSITAVAAVATTGVFLSRDDHRGDTGYRDRPPAASNRHPSTISPGAGYVPSDCVTSGEDGMMTLDLGCVEKKGFGDSDTLSPAVMRDLGAVVTVNTAVVLHYTARQKRKILAWIKSEGGNPNDWQPAISTNNLTGERVDIGGTVLTETAGHANEALAGGSCAGDGNATVVAGGSSSKRGYAVDMEGLQTSYRTTKYETAGDTDTATVETGGPNENLYNALPAIPVRRDAQRFLRLGDIFEALTEEPAYGSTQDQEQNSVSLVQRTPRVIRLVYIEQDPLDLQDGIFVPLGPSAGRQRYIIGGSSGSALVEAESGTEDAVLVRASTPVVNDTPTTISADKFLAKTGVKLVNGKQPATGIQFDVGQFIPGPSKGPITVCDAKS